MCEGHKKVATQLESQGDQLISCAADGSIRTWNWHKGASVSAIEAHTSAVRGIALIDGHILSAELHGIVKVWTSTGGQELSDLLERGLVIRQFRANHGKLVIVQKIRKGRLCIRLWDIASLGLGK